jgi:hypothetical protein
MTRKMGSRTARSWTARSWTARCVLHGPLDLGATESAQCTTDSRANFLVLTAGCLSPVQGFELPCSLLILCPLRLCLFLNQKKAEEWTLLKHPFLSHLQGLSRLELFMVAVALASGIWYLGTHLASREDLAGLKSELKQDRTELRSELRSILDALEMRTNQRLDALEVRTNQRLDKLDQHLDRLDVDMRELRDILLAGKR